MSWSKAWQSAGVGIEGRPTDVTVSKDLPLGLSLGARVRMHKTPFIRALGNGALIPVIDDTRPQVGSIGRWRLEGGMLLYRFYLLSFGDDPRDTFIQVSVDPFGVVSEVLYGRPLTKLEIQDQDEQAEYTGQSETGLGSAVYAVFRAELERLGFTDSALKAVMGESDSLEYLRDSAVDQPFIKPLGGFEAMIEDSRGFTGADRKVWFAPYVRQLGPDKEYLMVAAKAKGDGAEASAEPLTVELALGLPIDPSRLSVD